MQFTRFCASAVAALLAGMPALSPLFAQPLDKVRFGTNWVAEAEHGGFYQALADGTYSKYGLDVTIVPGGPNVNNRILLPVGKLDFFMSANTLQAFDAVAQNIPTVAVAAMLPEGPAGADRASRPGHREVRGPEEAHAVRLQGRHGQLFPMAEGRLRLRREQGEALHLQSAAVPRRQAHARCRATSPPSPTRSRSRASFKPKIFLLADQGFNSYSTLIETRRDLVEKKPDLVQRFVDASIIGWYNYLYGDNAAGNALHQEATIRK